MKFLFSIFLLTQILFSHEPIEIKGNMGVEKLSYNQNQNDVVINTKSELTLKQESYKLHAEIDFFYSQRYHDKRKIYFNELYSKYQNDRYTLQLGKILAYWGELEGYNIADVLNPKNTMLDMFDKSEKRGVWLLLAKVFEEDENLELGIKFYEDDNSYVDKTSPYNILPLSYNTHLQIANRYTPTVHLKYTFSSNESIESENSIILQKGYDNKRYFTPINNTQIAQYVYQVNKIMFLSNILYNDFIFKIEASYTDVIDESKMSDYKQFGVGIEKGFYDIYGIDITLYTEYYYYDYLDDTKPKNVDISELYDNDIFTALRFTFNDTRDSELKIGILKDITCNESIIKSEFKSRITNSMILSTEVLHFSEHFKTYHTLANHTRVKVALQYYF